MVDPIPILGQLQSKAILLWYIWLKPCEQLDESFVIKAVRLCVCLQGYGKLKGYIDKAIFQDFLLFDPNDFFIGCFIEIIFVKLWWRLIIFYNIYNMHFMSTSL